MNIFPEITMTKTEMDLLAEALSQPVVRKYLQGQAFKSGEAIVMAEPAIGETAESFMRRVAEVRGVIKCLEALLTIEKAEDPAVQS